MVFYVSMIKRPGKILFGLLFMIYRKVKFIEAKEIHGVKHTKKRNVFN